MGGSTSGRVTRTIAPELQEYVQDLVNAALKDSAHEYPIILNLKRMYELLPDHRAAG